MQLLQQLLHTCINKTKKQNEWEHTILHFRSIFQTPNSRCPFHTQTHAHVRHGHPRTLQHIWVIKIKIQANTLIFYVGENIIIYTIIHMLLYVNLCRNMLRLNVIYSLWYSKMCNTAPLLRENLYQEKSFTDTKQVYTKCEYFPGTIPCRNEIQGLILEVVMMHLELREPILQLRNFWYYNLYKFA